MWRLNKIASCAVMAIRSESNTNILHISLNQLCFIHEQLFNDILEMIHLCHPFIKWCRQCKLWFGYSLYSWCVMILDPCASISDSSKLIKRQIIYTLFVLGYVIRTIVLLGRLKDPSLKFNGGLYKPPLKLEHEWVISFHTFEWMKFLIDLLNPVIVWLICVKRKVRKASNIWHDDTIGFRVTLR